MKRGIIVLIAMIAITLSGCSKSETVTNEDRKIGVRNCAIGG